MRRISTITSMAKFRIEIAATRRLYMKYLPKTRGVMVRETTIINLKDVAVEVAALTALEMVSRINVDQ